MKRSERIELMSQRYSSGQDIFTGEPLPQDILDEIRAEDELGEKRSLAASVRVTNIIK